MTAINELAQEALKAAVSPLERTTEPDFFFLFGSLVFALDIGLTLVTGKNLWFISQQAGLRLDAFDWGKMLSLAVAYGFTMAIALKAMRAFIEEFIQSPMISLAVRLSPSKLTHSGEPYRTPQTAMKIALHRGDSLLYAAAEKEWLAYRKRINNQIRSAQLAFSFLAFMVIDRFIVGSESAPALLKLFGRWCGEQQALAIAFLPYIFWVVIIWFWLHASFFLDSHQELVYVPPDDGRDKGAGSN